MIQITRYRGKNLGRDRKKEEDPEFIAVCCPEEDVSEKVLLKLGEKLEGRGNVVMTRLNDDDLKNIDALVEVEVFKSRSEAVAFFINEGIRARKDLFQKVMPTVEKIRELKGHVKKSLFKEKTQ